jgi:electron transport complex protein RnfC
VKPTFSGGIHPPGHKESTAGLPVVAAPAPAKVTLPLIQHVGAMPVPLVKPGDRVRLGQKLADSDERVLAPIHASVSGTVAALQPFGHPVGRSVMSIIIDNDGADEADRSLAPMPDWAGAAPEALRARVREGGIVGMGGAGFPTHVKLAPPPDKRIDRLIINGVECEPYLTADHRLMLERPAEVLCGVRIMARILGLERATAAVEANKPDAARALAQAAAEDGSIEVRVVETKYPQGSEKQLIFALTGRKVPVGGLPMDVGVVVQNVATAFAVYEAVVLGRPLTRRIVTVTGSNIVRPGNFEARLGTPFAELIALAGGLREPGGKLVMGGPMMGLAVGSDAVPVIKGTSGILALSPAESALPPHRDCLRCGRCFDICPQGLAPALLMETLERGEIEAAQARSLLNCMECGSCTALCPARRPILQWVRTGKFELQKRRKKP